MTTKLLYDNTHSNGAFEICVVQNVSGLSLKGEENVFRLRWVKGKMTRDKPVVQEIQIRLNLHHALRRINRM